MSEYVFPGGKNRRNLHVEPTGKAMTKLRRLTGLDGGVTRIYDKNKYDESRGNGWKGGIENFRKLWARMTKEL